MTTTQGVKQQAAIADAVTPWQSFVRTTSTIWTNRKARVGVIVLLLFILVAIFAPPDRAVQPDRQQLRPLARRVAGSLARHDSGR